MDRGEHKAAAIYATSKADELAFSKGWFYGNMCAATPFHFNPYHELFYYEPSEDGEQFEGCIHRKEFEFVLDLLMRDVIEGHDFQEYNEYVAHINAKIKTFADLDSSL